MKHSEQKMEFFFRDFQDNLFSETYFFNVGWQKCTSSHAFGPVLRENYVIHYIIEGSGTFVKDGIQRQLTKGNFFIIAENEIAFYQANPDDPWEYLWIGFNGTNVQKLLALINVDKVNCVGTFRSQEEVRKTFFKLFKLDFSDVKNKLVLQSYFFFFLSTLTNPESIDTHGEILNSRKSYQDEFAFYIKGHYHDENLSIAAISQELNVHPSYLTQVIKAEINQTPSDFLRCYRMRKAARLVETSDLSYDEISEKVGYKSTLSFSRAFKKVHGKTPSKYAKEFKGYEYPH